MVPLVFAEDGQEQAQEQTQEQEDTESDVEDSNVTSETETSEDEYTGTNATLRERFKAKRVEIKEKVVQAREKVKDARQHYADVRQKYLGERQKFIQKRQEYLDCQDMTKEECKAKREELKGGTKPYLLNVADLVLGELDRIKEKVQSSEDLSEEEMSDIVADLDASITEVTDAKAVIENLDNESTKEEINAAAKIIRDAWKDTKVYLKKNTGRLVNVKLGNIIEKTETIEAKLTKVRDKLEEKGADVSVLDEKLADFSAKIDSARENYEKATEMFKEAKTIQDVNDAVQQAHQYMQDAKEALKEARDILREVVREIKSLNRGSLEVETTENPASDEGAEAAAEQA
jgi:tetratricopeptide (TPR) repeat protein